MHIYRLAAELGLLQLEYMDHDLASRIDSEQSQTETMRLQKLAQDVNQWGLWAAEIHASFVQKNRQWRGYRDVYDYKLVTQHPDGTWTVNNWCASLADCACPDFDERRLPCKQIYAVALSSNIHLPLSLAEYQTAMKRGEELFFHAWGEVRTKAQNTAAT